MNTEKPEAKPELQAFRGKPIAKFRQALPWAFAESAFSALMSFLTTLIAVRLIAPEDFGLASIAIAVVAIVQALMLSGPATAIIRMPQLDTRTSDSLFTSILAIGMVATILGLTLAVPVSAIFGHDTIFWLVLAQSLSCLFVAIEAVPAAILSRKMRTRSLAVRTAGQKIVTLLITAGAALSGLGPWSIILGSLAGSATSAFVLLLRQARKPRLTLIWGPALPVLRLGMTVGLETFAGALAPRALLLTFGHMQGIQALGYLNFGIRLVDEIANVLNMAITRVALPFFSSLKRAGYDERHAFARGTHAITLVAAPFLLGLAAISPVAVPLIFGERWIPGIPALQIVCVVWTLRFTRVLSPVVLLSSGIALPQLINSWVALVVGLVATFTLGQVSYEAALLAYLAPVLITVPLGAIMLARASTVTVTDQILAPLLPGAFAGCMFLAVTVLSAVLDQQTSAVVKLLSLIGTGIVVYGVLVLVFDRMRFTEVSRLVTRW